MRTLLLAALLLGSSVACSNDASPGRLDGGGAGGSSASPDLPSSLSFDSVEPLEARAEQELVVRALPKRSYRVRLSLPATDGDPKDAVLDRAEVVTDASGVGSVTLTAPSEKTSFQVRASVGSVTTSVPIDVLSSVTATLLVQPVKTGDRDATTWVASVHEGSNCDSVAGVPPMDGAKVAFASAGQLPELRNVEIGVPLAVTLRSGHFMGGCASLESLPAEAADSPRLVRVTVLERPIDLRESTLRLALGLAERDGAWSALTAAAGVEALAALRGNSVGDADALLDFMRETLSGSAQQSLESARTAENWDGLIQQRWGSDTRLRDLVSGWLQSGAGRLSSGEAVFVGQLAPASASKALLTLDTVAGVPATAAGFVTPTSVSWSAGADDTIVLATDLYFVTSQLATALAEPEALAAFDGTGSAAEALASALECTALGADLAAAGDDPVLAYPGCDAACISALCLDSLQGLWQRAESATATAPARLSVAGAGDGRVGDAAELAGIIGSWVGKLSTAQSEQPTGGALSAAELPLEAP